MMLWRNASLKAKIIFSTAMMIAACAGAIAVTLIMLARPAAETTAIKMVQEIAAGQASRIRQEVDAAIGDAASIARAAQVEIAGEAPRRSVVNHILRRIMQTDRGYAGAWIDMTDNGFDGRDAEFREPRDGEMLGLPGTGRMSMTWTKGESGAPEADTSEGLSFEAVQSEEYYAVASRARRPALTEPYVDEDFTQELMTSAAVPVLVENEVRGVAGIDISLASISDILNAQRPYGDGHVALISEKGMYIAHPQEGLRMQPSTDLPEAARAAMAQGDVFEAPAILGEEEYFLRVQPVDFGNVQGTWTLAVAVPMKSILAEANSLTLLCVLVGVVCSVIGGVVAWRVGRGIVQPVAAMTDAMAELAAGKLDVSLPATGQRDELGAMARALQVFKDNAVEMDRMRTAQHEREKEEEARNRALMLKMAEDFEREVKGVVTAVSSAANEMQSNAHSMSSIADRTAHQSATVSSAAEESSANLNMVASAAEELNTSIAEINRRIEASVQVASSCVAEAEATGQVMHDLNQAADDIGGVVKMIGDIASQVNLLALNATIEAARAGDAGRGFAVVASEVKNLADQVAKAAQDITERVSGIQKQTDNAVRTIDGITTTIHQINEISTAIAAAVEEQGSATGEISRTIQDTATGTGAVTQNIVHVRQSASETENAAARVLVTANELSEESRKLQNAVDDFIAHIRTAPRMAA